MLVTYKCNILTGLGVLKRKLKKKRSLIRKGSLEFPRTVYYSNDRRFTIASDSFRRCERPGTFLIGQISKKVSRWLNHFVVFCRGRQRIDMIVANCTYIKLLKNALIDRMDLRYLSKTIFNDLNLMRYNAFRIELI